MIIVINVMTIYNNQLDFSSKKKKKQKKHNSEVSVGRAMKDISGFPQSFTHFSCKTESKRNNQRTSTGVTILLVKCKSGVETMRRCDAADVADRWSTGCSPRPLLLRNRVLLKSV